MGTNLGGQLKFLGLDTCRFGE